MKSLKITIVFVGVLAFALQAFAQAPDTKNPQYQSKGDQKRSYKFEDTGEEMPYRIYVPSTWTPDKKVPLVLMLHGGGLDQNAPFDREPENLKGLLFKLAEANGYILVAPFGYNKSGGYGNASAPPPSSAGGTPRPAPANGANPPPNAQQGPPQVQMTPEERAKIAALSEKDTMNVLEMVATEYNVDRSKIFLMGNSMGSGGTIYLAAKYPEKWLAIAPSEGAMEFSRIADKVPKLKAKGVMIIKKDDTDASRITATEMVAKIRETGIDAELVVVPDSKHESAWYIALPRIFTFFDKFARKY